MGSILQLVPDPHPDDPEPDSQTLSVLANGAVVPSSFVLPGKEGLTRYYALMAVGDTDPSRHYKIGPLTKKKDNTYHAYLDDFAASLAQHQEPVPTSKALSTTPFAGAPPSRWFPTRTPTTPSPTARA